MSLTELDLMLRGASLGLAMLYALLMLRLPQPAHRLLGIGLALGVTAYLVQGGAHAGDWPRELVLVLRALAVVAVYCFWGITRLMFEDHFTPRPWHLLALLALMVVLALRGSLTPDAPLALRATLRWLVELPILALVAHALWCAGRDWAADLVDSRRRARLVFLAAGAVLPLLHLASAQITGAAPARSLFPLVMALGYLLIKLVLGSQLLRLQWVFDAPTSAQSSAPLQVAVPDADGPQVERVLAAMERDYVYRQTGLSIGALASQLQMPEYRLRALINQRLGYRNFNDFLNHFRLREAAARLRDPAQARLPILSIALDLGYASIGPFNRAFKARFGITPSEFRRDAAPADSPIS